MLDNITAIERLDKDRPGVALVLEDAGADGGSQLLLG
jgi:hypothetical protein